MEFHEKLQELRKSRGLTQEELAESLYVSRTAVSKWESGRGYPSIDSLKEISAYFSVSIDDLLSGEKILLIAEKENKTKIRSMRDMWFATTDICSFLLIILPLYPNTVDGYIYSVNLFSYGETTQFNRMIYWIMFIMLIGLGLLKALLGKLKPEEPVKLLTDVSIGLNIGVVLFLALASEPYAVIVAFLLLVIKFMLLMIGK